MTNHPLDTRQAPIITAKVAIPSSSYPTREPLTIAEVQSLLESHQFLEWRCDNGTPEGQR